MALRIISKPTFYPHEHNDVHALCAAGLAYFHVRKPQATQQEMAAWLAGIDGAYRKHLVLHAYPALMAPYGVGGLHIRETERPAYTEATLRSMQSGGFTVSTSVHTRAVLQQMNSRFTAVFYSPVFPSISKPGYGPDHDMTVLDVAIPPAIIALGGVDVHTIGRVRAMGYQGAALLGAVWQSTQTPVESFQQIQQLWRAHARTC